MYTRLYIMAFYIQRHKIMTNWQFTTDNSTKNGCLIALFVIIAIIAVFAALAA